MGSSESLRAFFNKRFAETPLEKNLYTNLQPMALEEKSVCPAPLPKVASGSEVEVMPLTNALDRAPEVLGPLLEKVFFHSQKDHKYFLMAKALFSSGLFVRVPDGVKEEISIDFSQQDYAKLEIPLFFNIFSIGDGASVKVFENNFSAGDFLSSSEIFAGAGASLEFACMHSGEGNFVSQKRFYAGENARVHCFSGFFGGSLCKAETQLVLGGAGAFASDSQACFASGRQHFDLTSVISHSAASTRAHAVAKAVLRDGGRSVLWGKIRIPKGSKKSDSFLAQSALVLNPGARADCMPTLEIEENDVRATHSSGVTHADDDALFYLSSRGIPAPDGKRLMASSFLESALGQLEIPGLRGEFEKQLTRKWMEDEVKVVA